MEDKPAVLSEIELLRQEKEALEIRVRELKEKIDSMALRKASLREEVRYLGEALGKAEAEKLRDSLTGLHTYDYLKQRVAELKQWLSSFKENQRESERLPPQQHLSLVVVDIDKFKNINDAYGHLTGDKVIIEMAKILKKVTRHSDIVTRKSGDEFVILMPFEEKADIKKAKRRLTRALKDARIEIESLHLKLSASVGYCDNILTDKLDLDKLFDLADKDMYAKKNKHQK